MTWQNAAILITNCCGNRWGLEGIWTRLLKRRILIVPAMLRTLNGYLKITVGMNSILGAIWLISICSWICLISWIGIMMWVRLNQWMGRGWIRWLIGSSCLIFRRNWGLISMDLCVRTRSSSMIIRFTRTRFPSPQQFLPTQESSLKN